MKCRVLGFIIFSMVLVGCGSSQPDTTDVQAIYSDSAADSSSFSPAAPLEKRDLSPAQLLGLRVIPEAPGGRDSELPDPAVNLDESSRSEDSTTHGNTVMIHSKLFLKDLNSQDPLKRRNLFFVWPEISLGSPIRSATFTRRTLTQHHQREVGSLNTRPVWHDSERHRWFVPLSELFVGEEMNVDMDDTQVLTLELSLESGPNQLFQVNFQASGPLPTLQNPSISMGRVGADAALFVRSASRDGLEAYHHTLTNPTSRAFQLWIRNRDSSISTYMTTVLQSVRYRSPKQSFLDIPWLVYFTSQAPFSFSHLVAEHEDRTREQVQFNGNEWVRVTLKPSETLVLSYWAVAAQGVRECILPASDSALSSFINSFFSSPSPNNTFLDIFNDTPLFSKPLPPVRILRGETSIAAVTISSSWTFEIRLAHSFTREEDVLERLPGDYFSLAQSANNYTRDIGVFQRPLGPFECQGVFR